MQKTFIYSIKDNSARKIRAVFIASVLFFLSPTFIWAQEASKIIRAHGVELRATTVDPEINTEFYSEGKLPEFPGGMEKLASFAKENLKYPVSAFEDEIQGTVLIEFTVDTSGKIIDIKIKTSVSKDIDKECLSMLRKMPVWEPGEMNGKAVDVQFLWPINFTIEEQ